jgi:hypothetical protein
MHWMILKSTQMETKRVDTLFFYAIVYLLDATWE